MRTAKERKCEVVSKQVKCEPSEKARPHLFENRRVGGEASQNFCWCVLTFQRGYLDLRASCVFQQKQYGNKRRKKVFKIERTAAAR